jgi:hypothetical protein
MSTARRPASRPGAARVRRALALAGFGVLGLTASACESTEQESAKIGRESQAAAQQAEPKHAKHAGSGGRRRSHAAPRPAHGGAG